MSGTQTKQFDTFDTLEDRREIYYLFEQLGKGLPSDQAAWWRGKFLEMLSAIGEGAMEGWTVTPCTAQEAYDLFWKIVGVLGVPTSEAARLLTECVRKKAWMTHFREACESGVRKRCAGSPAPSLLEVLELDTR